MGVRVSLYDYGRFGAILPSGLALSPPIEISRLSGRRVHYRFGNVGRQARPSTLKTRATWREMRASSNTSDLARISILALAR